MAQTIIIKNGTGSIANSDVVKGELAINTNTGNLYYGNTAGNVSSSFTFGGVTASYFKGDGSAITGVTGEWDGSHTGNAVITGNLTSTGNSTFGTEPTDTHTIAGDITASKNISASGILSGTRIHTTLGNTMTGTLAVGPSSMTAGKVFQAAGHSNFIGDITASGAISASGNIISHLNISAARIFQQGVHINATFSPIAGSSNIETVGTIGTGTWNGSIIAEAKLQNQSGTNTGDQDLSAHALQANVSSSFALQSNVSSSFALQSNVSSSFAQSANVSASFAPIASPSFTGQITASGAISASGTIYSKTPEYFTVGGWLKSTNAANYYGPHKQGPNNDVWNKSYGTDPAGSMSRLFYNSGIIVPENIMVTGFKATFIPNGTANSEQYTASLYVGQAVLNNQANNPVLALVQSENVVGPANSGNTNYIGTKVENYDSQHYFVSASSMIYPRFKWSDTNELFVNLIVQYYRVKI